MTHLTKAVSSLAALALITAAARPAHAGDKALAEELFRKGQNQLQKANASKEEIHQACLWLKESLDQDATVNTQVVLAACYEKEGKNRSAWGLYTDAASTTGPAAQYAKDRADALYKQGFLKLRIEVKDVPDEAKVTLDGETVGHGVLNTDINADPGEHTIRVRAEGKKDVDKKVELSKANSPLAVSIVLEDAPKPPPNTGGGGGVIVAPPAEQPTSTVRSVGIVIGIAGLAAGAGALISEILAQVFDANATKFPAVPNPPGCQGNATDYCQQKNKAFAAQGAAIGLGVTAGALLVTGVVMYFVGAPKAAEPAKASLRFVPAVGPNNAGGALLGTF